MKRIGVAGLIKSDRYDILLGRRGKDPNRGMYVMPGGGVNDGESLEEAFRREILEETGLEVESTVGYSRWELPHLIELPDRIILVAQASVKGDTTPKSGSDLYDVAWFDYFNLPHDISPVIAPTLAMYGYRPGKRHE
jgi:ADP-ribose pyrophosphatase YjhB (NUDIX family)